MRVLVHAATPGHKGEFSVGKERAASEKVFHRRGSLNFHGDQAIRLRLGNRSSPAAKNWSHKEESTAYKYWTRLFSTRRQKWIFWLLFRPSYVRVFRNKSPFSREISALAPEILNKSKQHAKRVWGGGRQQQIVGTGISVHRQTESTQMVSNRTK